MIPSPELSAKVQVWRQKVLAGTITMEELKEATLALRQGRALANAPTAGSRATKAAKTTPRDSEDMLKELGI